MLKNQRIAKENSYTIMELEQQCTLLEPLLNISLMTQQSCSASIKSNSISIKVSLGLKEN